MRLDVKLRDRGLKPGQAQTIERRARFALGRFAHQIRRAEVILSDVNGPRGGPDKHCTVRVMLTASSPVVVEITDVDPIAAVSRAVERAARHVDDGIKRHRDLRRLDTRAGRG
jgi:putative sigma-54 modulation protein